MSLPLHFVLASASLIAAEDRISFKSESGNFKLTYAKDWRKLQPPDPIFQLMVGRGGSVIMVSALETNATREELAASYQEDLRARGEFVKFVRKQEIAVARGKALVLELETKESGINCIVKAASFTHQGIAYRVIGVRALGNIQDFKEEFYSVLDSMEYLRERKEWLAKYEGQPTPKAVLSGLASFVIRQPRWTEETFEHGRDYRLLDQVHYRFLAGGAWLTIRGKVCQDDAATELQNLAHELAYSLQDTKVTPATAEGKHGKLDTLEITGSYGDAPRLIRAAVVVQDGIGVQVYLDSQSSQQENTRQDWVELLRSLRLQNRSRPDQPLAFPLQRSGFQGRADEGLGVFLNKASRLLPMSFNSQVRALSADAGRVLATAPQGTFVQNLSTHRRESVAANIAHNQPIAWSPDGKSLAYGGLGEIVVVGLDGKNPKHYPGGALHLAFGPGADELLLCTQDSDQPYPQAARYFTSRLEKLHLRTGQRQVLVDFPLGRMAYPAPSPDGRRLALVTNRDCSRTARTCGHLYVAAADGKGLRQLTREPEQISSVAWSGDGKWLYVVRRLAVGENGEVGIGGSPDLYRICPETGRAVNLTRSGRIGRAWSAGANLVVEINAWDLAEVQQGIFRIGAEDLARATAGRPIPPLADGTELGNALAAKVRASLGNPKVEDMVLTEALLEKAAQAFAGAAAPHGFQLDFTAPSLDRLSALAQALFAGPTRDTAVVLGLGAYYGQTLRRVAGAEWKLQPIQFGRGDFVNVVAGNALVQVVFPFGNWGFRREEDEPSFLSGAYLATIQGRKLLLVYPAEHGPNAVRQATPPGFQKAMSLLDAGHVQPALDLLTVEMRRQPRNAFLASEVFAVCQAVRRPDLARDLATRAVEAGSEVPELLLRHADELAKTQPQRALKFYRKAVQGNWPSAEALLKLGRHYATLGQKPLAEVCYRQAYWSGNDLQKKQARQLLGIPESPANSSATAQDPYGASESP